MKKLILIALVAIAAMGCKKDEVDNNIVDLSPKSVDLIFVNDSVASSVSHSLNSHGYSGTYLHADKYSFKITQSVKIGDTVSMTMATSIKVTTDYSLKILYGSKQVDFTDNVQIFSGGSTVKLKHVFREEDFK